MKRGFLLAPFLLLPGCAWLTSTLASALGPMPVPPNLANVRRIFIDKLSGGAGGDEMRDMIIAALMKSHLFLLTETSDRADAFLRGSADDQVYEEDHSSSESIGIHANVGRRQFFDQHVRIRKFVASEHGRRGQRQRIQPFARTKA